ncbi:MAG: hypothetical protein JNN07_22935 [Verrucomicrobiales bacterium]|nr:hypothetical protein [Verrucomicrobiales bacterium]
MKPIVYLPICAVAGVVFSLYAVQSPKPERVSPTVVNVQGATNWFAVEGLRVRADGQLVAIHKTIEIARLEVTANIHTAHLDRMVSFDYFENFGLPAYRVIFDRSGKVVSVTSRTATEQIDFTEGTSLKR